jgi:hypothetical protein
MPKFKIMQDMGMMGVFRVTEWEAESDKDALDGFLKNNPAYAGSKKGLIFAKPLANGSSYEVGEELFIRESDTRGPIKKGQEITYKGYKVKIKEEDEYPAGTPGWWAKILELRNAADWSDENIQKTAMTMYKKSFDDLTLAEQNKVYEVVEGGLDNAMGYSAGDYAAIAYRKYKKPYDELTPEEKKVVDAEVDKNVHEKPLPNSPFVTPEERRNVGKVKYGSEVKNSTDIYIKMARSD